MALAFAASALAAPLAAPQRIPSLPLTELSAGSKATLQTDLGLTPAELDALPQETRDALLQAELQEEARLHRAGAPTEDPIAGLNSGYGERNAHGGVPAKPLVGGLGGNTGHLTPTISTLSPTAGEEEEPGLSATGYGPTPAELTKLRQLQINRERVGVPEGILRTGGPTQ
ncbi:MAG: hypothetical protein M1829_002056 [Trizodia sp. TS-e1964]|nr:MAG: hypothetical protein M1829_002056 [Trizodia sp. TS-e1964]